MGRETLETRDPGQAVAMLKGGVKLLREELEQEGSSVRSC